METAMLIVDWLVFVGGLCTWMLFVPQIRKLNRYRPAGRGQQQAAD